MIPNSWEVEVDSPQRKQLTPSLIVFLLRWFAVLAQKQEPVRRLRRVMVPTTKAHTHQHHQSGSQASFVVQFPYSGTGSTVHPSLFEAFFCLPLSSTRSLGHRTIRARCLLQLMAPIDFSVLISTLTYRMSTKKNLYPRRHHPPSKPMGTTKDITCDSDNA